MIVNLTCVMLIMDMMQNPDIRKNDTPRINLLRRRDNGELPCCVADTSDDIKHQICNILCHALDTDKFHLEQVYTLGDKKYFQSNAIDVIHMGIMNADNINALDTDYEMVPISIENNTIKIGNDIYQYKTIEKIGNNIEYVFETNAPDINTDKTLIEILTTWKHLRTRLDIADALFKFMPSEFTLESVRQTYEQISGRLVDKSNFHKKITKYCVEVPDKKLLRGHRPSKLYKFQLQTKDLWL